MPTLELTAGAIEYSDTGGDGPALVFLHGLVMDGSVFDEVVRALRADFRCIVPTLPLGSHPRPMRADADLSLRGFGAMVHEILERLDLNDVTLVQNDHSAGLVAAGSHPERIGRLVISSCEAFDNYPPGLPGKNAKMLARIPGGFYGAMQMLRWRALRRLPFVLGRMAKRPVPDELTDRWFRPAQRSREIRRDLVKYAAHARVEDMLEVMERLRAFRGPVLVVWASEDRVMPVEHGRRLKDLFFDGRLVMIDDSYTLIPLDQPEALARHIRAFLAEAPLETSAAPSTRG